MPSDRKPNLILKVAVTLTVALGLYSGAYFSLVRPIEVGIDTSTPTGWRVLAGVRPGYPKWSTTLEFLFVPIHAIDRILRPNIWVPDREISRYDPLPTVTPDAEPTR